MNNDIEFPIPPYIVTSNNQQKEAYIFYVIQYCYKYGQPPSKQCKYISYLFVKS